MITSSCCQLLALLHNYRSALLVWWIGLLSALPTASDGLIEDLQWSRQLSRTPFYVRCSHIYSCGKIIGGKGDTWFLFSQFSAIAAALNAVCPKLQIANPHGITGLRLHDLLPPDAARSGLMQFRSINDVLVCLFINSDMCIIEDPEYLPKCLVMPLITLFHNAKSSRSANFHDQSTIMTAWRDGYTIATSKPSASETATSMPYTSSKLHLIERRKEVSKHLRYGSSAQINQRITRFEGANTEMKKLPYLVRCQKIGDQDVRARKRSSLAAR
ncbi:hypothetical protein D6D03_07206 [Aureobasidium pullulans]|nr:hypothetical protein D6D03_07206 [Aureobasidium pullulans]